MRKADHRRCTLCTNKQRAREAKRGRSECGGPLLHQHWGPVFVQGVQPSRPRAMTDSLSALALRRRLILPLFGGESPGRLCNPRRGGPKLTANASARQEPGCCAPCITAPRLECASLSTTAILLQPNLGGHGHERPGDSPRSVDLPDSCWSSHHRVWTAQNSTQTAI